VPHTQGELPLPSRSFEMEESEQDREARHHETLLRLMEEAADEVGRKNICYALNRSEQLLSKQLRSADGNRPDHKLLAYLLKHQKSGRLARWLLADYAGYLPPQRPDRIKPEEFAREVAAMAMGGTFGRNEAQQILALYERMERPK
jgi:hypothetical protein